MTIRSTVLLIAASVAALAIGVSSASAQEPGDLYATFGVGSTSLEPTNGTLHPEGTIVDVRVGDVLFDYDGWSVAIEAGAAYSDASASDNGTFCMDFDCDDVGSWTEEHTSKWSGTLGFVVSRPVGRLVVSVGAGVRVAEFTQTSHYDNAGLYDNETYTDTAVGFGTYVAARVDYPVNDRWSVGLGYESSAMKTEEWSSNYGSYTSGFDQTTWTAGFRRKF